MILLRRSDAKSSSSHVHLSHIARKSVWRHASEWATDEIVDAELLGEAINNF